MDMSIMLLLLGLAAGAASVWLVTVMRHNRAAEVEKGAQTTAARIVEEARKEADTLRKEAQTQAKDFVVQAKAEWEVEARQQRQEITAVERRVAQKEESIDRKIEAFAQRDATTHSASKSARASSGVWSTTG
jgi:ribonuclease Y